MQPRLPVFFIRVISLALALVRPADAQISPGELVAPKFEVSGDILQFTVQPSVIGRTYQLQWSDTLEITTWTDIGVVRSGDGANLVITCPHDSSIQRRFYRIALSETPAPQGFALVPAGTFQMGDQSNPQVGYSDERPVHSVYVSTFYMAKHEVTKELWDEVRAWGLNNGYTDLPVGNGSYVSKDVNHPVHSISWYAMVKWCNARSQKDGLTPCYTVAGATYKTGSRAPDCNWSANGYRLPTEAEWEKAARGGAVGLNFPWGDTISHSQANYTSSTSYSYDVSPTRGYHPAYVVGGYPYSSPVGSFAPNGYGLYDMSGNMWEWCWDWYASSYYTSSPGSDPRGPASGSYRVYRGGSWINYAYNCCAAYRSDDYPGNMYYYIGFRVARSSVP